MQSIQITAHVNDQGILQIPLPNHSGEELEILLVYQPISKPIKRQWSQQFLSTFGAWQGEPHGAYKGSRTTENLQILTFLSESGFTGF